MSSLSASLIKNYIQSNLTGLYGSLGTIEIDSIKQTGDDIEVKGSFYIPFGDTWSFTMTIDTRGNMKGFNREKPKPKNSFL